MSQPFKSLFVFVAALALASVAPAEVPSPSKEKSRPAAATARTQHADKKMVPADPEQVDWSKIDWRKRLTKLQYYITREAGTERPFQNEFWNFFKPGEYRCVSCGLPLFGSDAKFDSECGWPSFDKTIAKDAVTEHVDLKLLQPRTEIRCRRCQAHLGHVFNDGPTKTGQRYCLNSAAMAFVPEKQLAKDAKQQQPQQATKPAAERPEKSTASVENKDQKP